MVIVPHLGSATGWTREGMATLAAANVEAVLNGWPVWPRAATLGDVLPFLGDDPPPAAPSIVNAAALGLPRFAGQAPTHRTSPETASREPPGYVASISSSRGAALAHDHAGDGRPRRPRACS